MTQWLADTYVEPTDLEWTQEYLFASSKRKDQLDEEGLTTEELLELRNDELFDLFAWYLGQPSEVQQRYARQLAKGLAEARKLRDSNRGRAQRMLDKQWARCDGR
jgi:hypothetical protein